MSDREEQQGQGQPEQSGVMASVSMAFNLGVAATQHGGTKSIASIASELKDSIYQQIKKIYGDQLDEPYLQANVEYFTQIALLGYIIPSICVYDENFKNRLFQLLEAKLGRGEQPSAQTSQDPNIIVP